MSKIIIDFVYLFYKSDQYTRSHCTDCEVFDGRVILSSDPVYGNILDKPKDLFLCGFRCWKGSKILLIYI